MRLIAVSMRVDIASSYNERRDAIDQRWYGFFEKSDIMPLLMPNDKTRIVELLGQNSINGIVLTGGNTLVKYGGDAPERDIAERYLLEYALRRKIPLIGVCRGMQFIQDYFGVELKKVSNHVAAEQEIVFNNKKMAINSFHTMGAMNSTDELKVIGASNDGVIEAVRHVNGLILGLMWHPERFLPFRNEDINLFKEFFSV